MIRFSHQPLFFKAEGILRQQLKRLENCAHRDDSFVAMKSHFLLTTIAAVVLVGCGESQQSTPAPEAKPAETVTQAAKPELPTAKAPNIPIAEAIKEGDIEAVKQHLAAGADVNAIVDDWTPLHNAAEYGQKEIGELLIEKGANVNTRDVDGETPLDVAIHPENSNNTDETADLLRKHGGKTRAELKAEGK